MLCEDNSKQRLKNNKKKKKRIEDQYTIFLLKKNKKNNSSNFLAPPGPPGLPLIGNLYQICTASTLHVYLSQLSQKYGPIMQLKMGSVTILVVSSAKFAKEALKNQDIAFSGRPGFVGQQKLTYNCSDMVFSPYGDYWRELRKIASVYLLSGKKVQSFRPIREDEICRLIKKISDVVLLSDGVVNLSEMAMAVGGNLICRTAFGKRYEENGSEMQRFDELLKEAQALLGGAFVSDFFPAFCWVDRLSGLINRLDKAFKNLDTFYEELIQEHIDPKRAKVKMGEDDDILDVLIHLKQQNLCSIDFNWDSIKALLTDVFIAATDTSAASTVWTLTALMKAPNVMKKLQAEIRNLIGKKGRVDEDDLPKLPYLKAVINEGFRLYPPAPLLVPRETTEHCTLVGFEIRPKTVVYINVWAIGRDPEYWENPDEFFPERFLNSDIDVKGQDFGVIPFGSGRRICPGMFMGLANVELTIANLLYSFDWELPNGIEAQDIDTHVLPGITTHKKNPLLLVAKKYIV